MALQCLVLRAITWRSKRSRLHMKQPCWRTACRAWRPAGSSMRCWLRAAVQCLCHSQQWACAAARLLAVAMLAPLALSGSLAAVAHTYEVVQVQMVASAPPCQARL